MPQVVADKILVWREIRPSTYSEFSIPREQVKIGDVIYDRTRDSYHRIIEIVLKEPGNYADMEFSVKPEPTFFVFNKISPN